MSTPELYIRTGFVLNNEGRIVSTREPTAKPGPLFTLVRAATSCAWAVRADLAEDLAGDLDSLAREEAPGMDLHEEPVYADRYQALIQSHIVSELRTAAKIRWSSGPAFVFPDTVTQPIDVVIVEDERLLQRNFTGWKLGEIAAGRSPVLAIFEGGYPVSVCCSARRSRAAAEAGLETAEAFRGRGFGPRATAAWALAIRATGRVPLYSTERTNRASLSVARKLSLEPYASIWSLSEC